jgi:hypothetical protein
MDSAYTNVNPVFTHTYTNKLTFNWHSIYVPHQIISKGWDSAVGIATRYELDGPGIENRLGRDFPHLSRPDLRPIQPPIQWVPDVFRGKAAVE